MGEAISDPYIAGGHEFAPKHRSPLADLHEEVDNHWPDVLQTYEDLRSVSNPGKDAIIAKHADEDDLSKIRQLGVPGPPQPLMSVIDEAYQILGYRICTNHPLFLSFTPPSMSDISWIAESLVCAFNAHVGGRVTASGPCALEHTMTEWLASKLNFPPGSGGIFVSGGSIANMMAIAVARDQILKERDSTRAVLYIGDQAHYSIAKAARVLGFRDDQIHSIKSDSRFRICPGDLKNQVRKDKSQGLIPFLVIGSFGCTETGAIDPLEQLADIAGDEKLWLHVDGAFGASVTLSNSHHHVAKDLSRADSIAWDAHKWLFQSYGCGMLLVRDKNILASSFHAKSTLLDNSGRVNNEAAEFWDLGLELTRPSRAMSLWFTLRLLGVERAGQMIDHGIHLTELVEDALRSLPGWDIITPASLAILTFRYNAKGRSEEILEKINTGISKELLDSNAASVMTVRLKDGLLALRVCCINPQLTSDDIAELVANLHHTAIRVSWNVSQ